jgi:hypothetical protein
MNRTIVFACLFGLLAGFPGANAQVTEQLDQKAGVLEWRFNNRKLLVYAFATNQFKPFVRELYTLRGENVLRDAPPDHLHHHGLMYAIRINGTNFWEEVGAPGVEKSVRLLGHKTGKSAAGLPEAQFTQLIHWLPVANRSVADSAAAALLIERRTLSLTVDEKNQEVALRWDAAFEVGKNAGKVSLHGSQYNGLGLRLPKSFDHVAKFQNSAGTPYTGANARNLIPAQWTSASGVMDGRDVMAVLFGTPKNVRGPGEFYTLLEPFAYLSVTQGLEKESLEYSAGDKFAISYLLTVYPESKTRDFIQQRDARWEKKAK